MPGRFPPDSEQDVYKRQDDNGHGTHVCGIIAGNGRRSEGRYRGIAPESHLVVGKILDSNGNGSISHILEAVRWIIENRQRYNIRVLNISVGSESTEVDEQKSILVQSVNAAWDSGIVEMCIRDRRITAAEMSLCLIISTPVHISIFS